VPIAGAVEVTWCKRRWFCDALVCPRGTFTESTVQVLPPARSPARLRRALVEADLVVSTFVGMRGLRHPHECVRVATIETFAAAIRRDLSEADAAVERTIGDRRAVEQSYDRHAVRRSVVPRLEALANPPPQYVG